MSKPEEKKFPENGQEIEKIEISDGKVHVDIPDLKVPYDLEKFMISSKTKVYLPTEDIFNPFVQKLIAKYCIDYRMNVLYTFKKPSDAKQYFNSPAARDIKYVLFISKGGCLYLSESQRHIANDLFNAQYEHAEMIWGMLGTYRVFIKYNPSKNGATLYYTEEADNDDIANAHSLIERYIVGAEKIGKHTLEYAKRKFIEPKHNPPISYDPIWNNYFSIGHNEGDMINCMYEISNMYDREKNEIQSVITNQCKEILMNEKMRLITENGLSDEQAMLKAIENVKDCKVFSEECVDICARIVEKF